jgi:hypothetical protein
LISLGCFVSIWEKSSLFDSFEGGRSSTPKIERPTVILPKL